MKTFRPITPSLRWTQTPDFSEITKDRPEKSLVAPLRKHGGRNMHGHVTCRHKGGGHKRMIRLVDFKRDIKDIQAQVEAIEYDPNRSARLALLKYPDGQKRYIIAPLELKVGDEITASNNAEIKPGNALPLKNIPAGTFIHNIELYPGRGAQIVRSAGASAQIMAKEGTFAHVKLPSGEVRLINLEAYATIGQIGNIDHEAISIGKAGRTRWLGIRPSVRGVAQNPHDHPMGGGEGKSSGGRHPCSPWGVPSKGYKTRKKKKISDRYIVKRRN